VWRPAHRLPHGRSFAKDFQRPAKQITGLGIGRLESLAEKMFGKSLVALTTLNASELIDTLKAVKDGKLISAQPHSSI